MPPAEPGLSLNSQCDWHSVWHFVTGCFFCVARELQHLGMPVTSAATWANGSQATGIQMVMGKHQWNRTCAVRSETSADRCQMNWRSAVLSPGLEYMQGLVDGEVLVRNASEEAEGSTQAGSHAVYCNGVRPTTFSQLSHRSVWSYARSRLRSNWQLNLPAVDLSSRPRGLYISSSGARVVENEAAFVRALHLRVCTPSCCTIDVAQNFLQLPVRHQAALWSAAKFVILERGAAMVASFLLDDHTKLFLLVRKRVPSSQLSVLPWTGHASRQELRVLDELPGHKMVIDVEEVVVVLRHALRCVPPPPRSASCTTVQFPCRKPLPTGTPGEQRHHLLGWQHQRTAPERNESRKLPSLAAKLASVTRAL